MLSSRQFTMMPTNHFSMYPGNKYPQFNHGLNDFLPFFGPTGMAFENMDSIRLLPLVDFSEEKDCYKIQCEMPGMTEENIKVSFDNNQITIEGEKSFTKTNGKNTYVTREISYGRYERTFALPVYANCDKAIASFKKGTLWVTIPKKAGSKTTARTIKVTKAK